MSKKPYAIAIMKRTAGLLRINVVGYAWANWQHVTYFFSEVEILNIQKLEQDAILPIHQRVD